MGFGGRRGALIFLRLSIYALCSLFFFVVCFVLFTVFVVIEYRVHRLSLSSTSINVQVQATLAQIGLLSFTNVDELRKTAKFSTGYSIVLT